MHIKMFLSLLLGLLITHDACAQIPQDAIPSFSRAWQAQNPVEEEEILNDEPLPRYEEEIGKFAIKNIFEAEQVFCYEIFPQDYDYNGYTLNGYPIKGYCGTLSAEQIKNTRQNLFSSSRSVDFTTSEECLIQPKIMLRFVRGVDYTDVMLSSPCHATAIFYADRAIAYNFRPGAQVIDNIIKERASQHKEFISPALLGQLAPNGAIQNNEQRKMISKNNEPIRKWEEKAQQKVDQQDEEIKRQNTGWNKLKTRLQ